MKYNYLGSEQKGWNGTQLVASIVIHPSTATFSAQQTVHGEVGNDASLL
jgi:hypothetical protein